MEKRTEFGYWHCKDSYEDFFRLKQGGYKKRPAMKKIGIFGWGVVTPKSPNIDVFEQNLDRATSWLEPFDGFGPSHFLVGRPDLDFTVCKPWIDARFEPRKYSQLNDKMGNTVKYALGAFIQALGQNPEIEELRIIISS
jgi:3-oxoacyl-[acyl-carrier-protein] synthase II